MLGPHGLRGELRVRVYGDGPDHLLAAREVALADAALGAVDPAPRVLTKEGGGRGRDGEVRLKLAGIEDRAAAAVLAGRLVVVPSSELPELHEDEFYWYELIGCEVVEGPGAKPAAASARSEGAVLGIVEEIWETGAHDLLVVRDAGGRRQLIPTAREFVRDIDREARRIVVVLPPGLWSEAEEGG